MAVRRLLGLTWNHDRGLAPMVATAAAFSKLHRDIEVEWSVQSLQGFASHPVTEIAREYDLMVIDHPHLGEATQAGVLVPLDQWVGASELAEMRSSAIGPAYRSYEFGGHLYGLPIDVAAQVAAFRPDRLADEDVPVTWDAVRSFAGRRTTLWPLKPIDALCSFLTLAANDGTPAVDAHGDFLSVSATARFLKLLKSATKLVPDRCHTADPIEILEAISTEGAWEFVPLTFGYTNYSRAGYRPYRVRFGEIPTVGEREPSGSVLGGAGLAVSALRNQQADAIAYATWVASPLIQSTTYVRNGGQPGLAAAWDDEEANRITDDFFRRTRRTLEGSWLRPRDAGFIGFQDEGGPLVSAYLRRGADEVRTASALRDAFYRSVSRT